MSDADAPDDPAEFHDRLDGVAEAIETAATEDDLDDIDADLAEIAEAVEAATFPEPEPPEDEEDDEPPDPAEELEERIDELQADADDKRGPYAEDVTQTIGSVAGTVERTEWASEGVEELRPVITDVHAAVEDALGESIEIEEPMDVESYVAVLQATEAAVEAAALDPDDDADVIAALLEATDALETGVDDATAFGDLPVREQLNRRGFFDVLGHYKDFPPEWSAIKAHEEERNVEMILLAFDLLDSNFMEEHCVDALRRLGDERALDDMLALARRRDHGAIGVLGAIGDAEPVDMLLDYVDTPSDPQLQQVSLRAIGEIGSTEATEDVAQQLVAEEPTVRSAAARALGMIGDPRAVAPLETVLAEDEAPEVRGSAAWALVEIGTNDAYDVLDAYRRDGEYLVEAEVMKVAPSSAD